MIQPAPIQPGSLLASGERPPSRSGGGIRVSGACYATFAYDIGFSIDLDAAQRLLATRTQRESLKHQRRAPKYFQFRPAPLEVPQPAEPIHIAAAGGKGEGAWRTGDVVDCVLYDFGAVSVTYRIPIDGPLAGGGGMLELSDALYDNAALLADSRRRVERLLESIRPAVTNALVTDLVEDYAIYQIERASDGDAPPLPPSLARTPASDGSTPAGWSVDEFIRSNARTLAQVLRAEREVLSDQEAADALASRICYTPDDAAIIDFNGAILLLREDQGAEDVRDVLAFANVELLEMRLLDDRLDAALERAYQAMSREAWTARLALGLGSEAADLSRIARLQVDGALLFEGVNNALKLIGDQYLARVYRLAGQRLHLPEWDASILRKLETVESIYQKLFDRQSNRRMEFLEWIIILLIAFEIVMTFIPGLRGR